MPHFSLEEARQLLPWLRSTLQKMDPLRQELSRLEAEMKALLNKSRGNGGSSGEEALRQRRKRGEELTEMLNSLMESITAKGIVLRDMERGLIDFPSMREGREICLCWLLEEPDVGYWHETDTGFASRKRL